MKKELMPDLVQHLNEFVLGIVAHYHPVLSMLDGHSSRKGDEWIMHCKEDNIIVVELPTTTSHFLQTCDASIHETFKEKKREVRDITVKT